MRSDLGLSIVSSHALLWNSNQRLQSKKGVYIKWR